MRHMPPFLLLRGSNCSDASNKRGPLRPDDLGRVIPGEGAAGSRAKLRAQPMIRGESVDGIC